LRYWLIRKASSIEWRRRWRQRMGGRWDTRVPFPTHSKGNLLLRMESAAARVRTAPRGPFRIHWNPQV